MKMNCKIATALVAGAAIGGVALVMTDPASAADLNVISNGALRGVINGMIDDYSHKTGHKFQFTFGSTGLLRNAIGSGQPADLILTTARLIAELEKTGKLTPGSRVDLGRVGLGVVVRAGTPLPDISTPEAVKQALINAMAVAYVDPALDASSVLQLFKFTDAMGIKDQVIRKGVHGTSSNDAVTKLAQGKADIAVVLISEIHYPQSNKDAVLVGPLPEAIQAWITFAAVIPSSSNNPTAARAFIAALASPDMHKLWTDYGFEQAAK
jgi:molybdate transport system substrate-binding protein